MINSHVFSEIDIVYPIDRFFPLHLISCFKITVKFTSTQMY